MHFLEDGGRIVLITEDTPRAIEGAGWITANVTNVTGLGAQVICEESSSFDFDPAASFVFINYAAAAQEVVLTKLVAEKFDCVIVFEAQKLLSAARLASVKTIASARPARRLLLVGARTQSMAMLKVGGGSKHRLWPLLALLRPNVFGSSQDEFGARYSDDDAGENAAAELRDALHVTVLSPP